MDAIKRPKKKTIKGGFDFLCSGWIAEDGRTLQPIELIDGVARFRANEIVKLLLADGNYDMNRLALLPFTDSDREQFAQLIGYSVGGFAELPYVSDEAVNAADKVAKQL